MPSFSPFKSKKALVDEDEASIRSSAGSIKASVKRMPSKVAKGVKRQLWRLDEALHHVTGTKHKAEESKHVRSRTVSTPTPIALTFPSSRAARKRTTSTFIPAKSIGDVDSDHSSVISTPSRQPSHMADDAHPLPSLPPMAEDAVPEPEPIFNSPPTVYVEAEAPDPFLIDEDGDALSAGEEQEEPSVTPSPAHEVPLELPKSPLPDVNKDVPPPPSEDSEDSEDDDAEVVPDVYAPALVQPNMFLPIPNTDPLTTLLNKYIYPPDRRPPRDLTGDWQRADFHTLVMTNSWRALARMARDRLVTSDPSDLPLVLGLWHLRLSCLARLRLFNQTSAECTNLFAALSALEPPDARAYVLERILPFELEVMHARLKYWAGDHMGYVDALHALLAKCRTQCRAASARGGARAADEVPMWKERAARVCLILASQLVEMKELTAATRLLEPLVSSQPDTPSPELRSSIARVYLQAGNLVPAREHIAVVAADPRADPSLQAMNAALLAAAEGDWAEAEARLKGVLDRHGDGDGTGEGGAMGLGVGGKVDFVAVNNLAVALMGQGKLKEGIEILEDALHTSPASVVVAEPFLFNLSTLYELRSTVGLEKKKALLIEVAKWSGDGLRATCLKMPAN